ncbi:uncharacterized protein LOC136034340 [Artemia franciscana]|uniref:uncharacterized protein LOC136034340 n=1 Tax=Artemia franciscana TaxID=6661 RepID=UPI0032DB7E61
MRSQRKAREVGLSINVDKSKSLSTSGSPLTLQCSDKSVEQVQEFKYLGSWIENTGDVTFEIKRRIGQASGAFNRLTPIWRSNKYSLRLKLRLFNSNVLSILMHASECWKLNQQLEKRILGFENICLRRILKISWHPKITNREIRLKTNQPIVTEVLKKRRWTYLGHVLSMPEDRLPSRVYQWQPEGTRRRGRPKHTLWRQYDRDLKKANISPTPQWEDITAAAELRDEWIDFVDALCATDGSGGSKV